MEIYICGKLHFVLMLAQDATKPEEDYLCYLKNIPY